MERFVFYSNDCALNKYIIIQHLVVQVTLNEYSVSHYLYDNIEFIKEY